MDKRAMTLEEQLTHALVLASLAHDKQVDKAGMPYILHPLWVMSVVDTLEEKVVAVLHDVVEDTDLTLLDLSQAGFDAMVVEAIDILSRRRKETYAKYIDRIAESNNKVAINVKISDLYHNSNVGRLKDPTEKDFFRVEKYELALQRLRTVKSSWQYENCEHDWEDTGYWTQEQGEMYSLYVCSKCGKRENRKGGVI